jgi:hypothetical protein
MVESDRLTCPLLLCTQQFSNHEAMLRHLAVCEHMSSYSYWCFEHSRVERFDDSKCKRCLSGGKSKRRKMLCMAKSFFSSLGHKSKKASDLDLGLSESAFALPSSYEEPVDTSLCFELSATEIVEIDSVPVQQPTPAISIDPQALLLPPELDSTAVSVGDAMHWQPSPILPEAFLSYADDQTMDRSPTAHRPSLQLHTQGLEQYRKAPRPRPVAPPVARSKNLSPSSSVRSTTSTMSSISSIISPVSAAWSHGSNTWSSGLDTSLTSPTTDVGEPLPEDNLNTDAGLFDYTCPPEQPAQWFSELPADVPTKMEPLASLASNSVLFPFEPILAGSMSYDANIVLTEESTEGPSSAQLHLENPMTCYSEAKGFVESTWDLLIAHITTSQAKVQDLGNNILAQQLKALDPKSVAQTGLATLKTILDGAVPASAMDAICFMHLICAFSIILYGKEAGTQCKRIFARALVYGQYFPTSDQAPYAQIVTAIWQPEDISQNELRQRVQQQYNLSLRRSSSQRSQRGRGKRACTEPDRHDPLVSTARSFLDGKLSHSDASPPSVRNADVSYAELEMSAILGQSSSSIEVLTSLLSTKHYQQSERKPTNQAFGVTIDFILNVLLQTFPDVNGLQGKLQGLHRRVADGSVRNVRKAELELLQAGKASMAPSKFLDKFVPQVRDLFDPLYAQHEVGDTQRCVFNTYAVDLMETIIAGICPSPSDMALPLDDAELEEFLKWTENTSGSVLATEPANVPEQAASAVPATSLSAASCPASNESQQDGSRVEANDCCDICGYRPKGDPQWFRGSMNKHKKLQHSTEPPKIYKCPFPGCTSQYKNRPDNLRQHQIEKNHWIGEEAGSKKPRRQQQQSGQGGRPTEEDPARRPSKRKKVSE